MFGGIHAGLYPDEVREHGSADAVVTGDGDAVWARWLAKFVRQFFVAPPMPNLAYPDAARRRETAWLNPHSDT